MRQLALLSMLALAACGADGDPIRPEVTQTIGISNDGIGTQTGVTLRRGPVAIGVGF